MTIEKNFETKEFFEKINKIDESLARWSGEKKRVDRN